MALVAPEDFVRDSNCEFHLGIELLLWVGVGWGGWLFFIFYLFIFWCLGVCVFEEVGDGIVVDQR